MEPHMSMSSPEQKQRQTTKQTVGGKQIQKIGIDSFSALDGFPLPGSGSHESAALSFL